jgi:hypothetical protein
MTRTRRLTAVCLTIAALAGPASAQAYPLIHGPAGDAPDPDLIELDMSDVTPTRTIVVGDTGGVDWADAGAGFAAAACLGLLAAGTFVTVRAPRRSS